MYRKSLSPFLLIAIAAPQALLSSYRESQAAEHGVRGCVLVEDTRAGVTTAGQLVGLENLKITLEYKTIVGDLPIIGELRTNSSGCFNGSIYGLTVPEKTEITATATLEDSEWVVDEGKVFSVYQISLGRKSVSSGGSANFGDTSLESTDRDQDLYGAGLVWLSGKNARSLFNTHIGSFPGGQVEVEFPTSDQISNADNSGIRLTSSAVTNFNGTFLHEYGHVINGRNNILESPNDYCARKEYSTYPKTQPPYPYIDPNESSGSSDPADKNSCGHGWGSAEHESEAITEGFADAMADWLSDRKCKNVDYSYALNFDGKMREMNYEGLLCDLVDSDSSSTTYLHTYGEPGHMTFMNGLPGGRIPFVSGTSAWVPSGTKIYQANLSTGQVSLSGDLSKNGYADVPKVVHSGNITCAKANYKFGYMAFELVCKDQFSIQAGQLQTQIEVELPPGPSDQTMPENTTMGYASGIRRSSIADVIANSNSSGTSDTPARTSGHGWTVYAGSSFPDPTFGLYDIDSSQGRLYAYGSIQGGAEMVLYSADPSTTPFVWREESRIQRWGAMPYLMAVDAGNSHLYLAVKGVILRCKFNRCSNGGIQFAGSEFKTGYQRGQKNDAILSTIQNMFVADSALYIQDDYGVSRVDLSRGTIEQFVGRGEDPVFLNNLALRSLDVDFMMDFGFHSDGVRSIYTGGFWQADDHRSETEVSGTLVIDHTKKVTTELYCGSDPVSQPASKVFHLHKNSTTGDPDASQLFDAIQKSISISDSDLDQLKKSNWLKLSQAGCTFTGGSAVLQESTESILAGRKTGMDVGALHELEYTQVVLPKRNILRPSQAKLSGFCGGVSKTGSRSASKSRLKYDRIRTPPPSSGFRAREIPRAMPATYPKAVRLEAAKKK